ncbi:MAG TPA: glycosyltransferase [Gemmatimonadaceae bacterium]|jgi:spore maturation protein CgeB|nr:glycosyltransferase [Gemmatimonadaceae bacterium]
MRIVMFYHSLRSDWNHGNAHFLRGVVSELLARDHEVTVYEPRDAWSAEQLVAERGLSALDDFRTAYPGLASVPYDLDTLDLDEALDGADLVLVHEWNDHALVARIGAHRAADDGYTLLFHDTHHRAVTDASSMSRYDLRHYDGVLVFGAAIRDVYERESWAEHVYVWHEAADTRVFAPRTEIARTRDLVWIGNWGDDERTAELHEFLVEPVAALRLDADVYGVRYPVAARDALAAAGLRYRGWLPNYEAPAVFAAHRVTVHVPRRPYVQALPGIPTIRVFEALACGIPLVSAPWDDAESLFSPGADYLVAGNGAAMHSLLRAVVHDSALADALRTHGLATIRARHTCAHRVDELLAIVASLASATTARQTIGASAPG